MYQTRIWHHPDCQNLCSDTSSKPPGLAPICMFPSFILIPLVVVSGDLHSRVFILVLTPDLPQTPLRLKHLCFL